MAKKEEIIDGIIEDLFKEKSPDVSMCDNEELLSIVDLVLLLKKGEKFDASFKSNLEVELLNDFNEIKSKNVVSYGKSFWSALSRIIAFFSLSNSLPLDPSHKSFEEHIDSSLIKAYAMHTLNLESLLYNYSSVGYWLPKLISTLQ